MSPRDFSTVVEEGYLPSGGEEDEATWECEECGFDENSEDADCWCCACCGEPHPYFRGVRYR